MNPREGGSFATFEQLFAVREYNETLGVNVLDVSPNQPEGTAYFSPGWNASIADYKNPISSLYYDSRRVLSAEFSPREEDKKANAIVEILERKGVEKVDFVAHSVGSISAVLAAEKLEDRVGKVILVNPPSMIGEESEKVLIGRYNDTMKKEGEDVNGSNNTTRKEFFDMARTIVNFDMFFHLTELQKKGVKVVTVHSVGDSLFPARRVCDESRSKGWSNFVIVPGGHMSISEHMEPAIQFLKS